MVNWKEDKHISVFLNMLGIGFIVASLGCSGLNKIQIQSEAKGDWNTPIDYTNLDNWAAHPSKKDPSDTVPQGLIVEKEKQIDVFFIHPTTYTGKLEKGKENALITDVELNKKTDESPIRFQASAFNESSNVYAPRYRQAHIQMYQEKDTAILYEKFGIAYNDVKNAFISFLEHNQQRPFIIASHSQGTTHAKRLIKEMVEGKSIQKRMVAAYLIGMPVEKNYFEKLCPCTDSLQTNCFVSWRTFRNDYDESWANRLDTGIVVVNPISWKTTEEILAKDQHRGAILYNMNKTYAGTHQTQVEGSGLWISKPKFPGSFLYKTKNYHVGDINLFYLDIRKNVKQRIQQYQKNQNH
ncbi:MAG: hypothetical protein RLZZ64_979 [Bacteroidota bacterium]|jgi:hypothetical protein